MNTDKITELIIGCAMNVSNGMGAGFLKKVYENALSLEMESSGLDVETQKLIEVFYKGTAVGKFYADLAVGHQVIVEVKAVKVLDENHQAQLLNYMKATGMGVGLILNFGTPRLGIKRMVL